MLGRRVALVLLWAILALAWVFAMTQGPLREAGQALREAELELQLSQIEGYVRDPATGLRQPPLIKPLFVIAGERRVAERRAAFERVLALTAVGPGVLLLGVLLASWALGRPKR